MRVKTDARRAAIVRAAWEVFREHGFERATMSEVSARVGGSKATLYGYFGSKEELFFAAIEDALEDQADEAFDRLEGAGDLRDRLTSFALAYLQLRLSPEPIALSRMLVAEADRSTFAVTLRAKYMTTKWRRVAAALEREMKAGRLRSADPDRATTHLRALIEADLVERRLHGEPPLPPAVVATETGENVDVFLRAYAPA